MELDVNTRSICFDDILLVPKHSKILTRSSVSLNTVIGNVKNPEAWVSLQSPIVMAPMEFISSPLMIEKVIHYGGIAFVQRHQDNNSRIFQLDKLSKTVLDIRRLGFAINIAEVDNKELLDKVLSYGTKMILLDIAFGHTQGGLDAVEKLRSYLPKNIHIMSGNVSSYEAYKDLMDAGCDSVRVGIGGGASCTTRVATGFGVPVLSSIMDIFDNIKDQEVNGLISDGAIKSNGDIVKAMAAGASAVMMGAMFAGHDECDRLDDGSFIFRGMASESIQRQKLMSSTENIYVEGVEGKVQSRGSVDNTIKIMLNNIKSGLTYAGADHFEDFRKNVRFIEVSPLSIKESGSRL